MKYKRIIKSHLLSFVAHLLPLALFDYLAIRASRDSRKRSSKYSIDETKVFFREGAMKLAENSNSNIVILGHSHIDDSYEEKGTQYFNVGFSPTSKKFFYWDGEIAQLLSI